MAPVTDADPLICAIAGEAKAGAAASTASSGSVPRVNQNDDRNVIHSKPGRGCGIRLIQNQCCHGRIGINKIYMYLITFRI